MKKIVAVSLSVMLILLCCACKSNKNTTQTDNNGNSISQNSGENTSLVPEQNGENILDDNTNQSDGLLQNGGESQNIDNSSQIDGFVNIDSSSQLSGDSSVDNNSQNIDTSSPDNNLNNDNSQNVVTSTPDNTDSSSGSQSDTTSTPTTSNPANSSQGGTSTPNNTNSSNSSQNDVTSSSESNSQNNSSANNSSQKTEKVPGSAILGDTPTLETYITIEDDTANREIVPEYGTVPSTLETKWDADTLNHKGNSDELANELRQEIVNSPNTADIYDIKGTIYYVSPNGDDNNDGKTPETAVRSTKSGIFTLNILKPGDAVLFERNGLWRLTGAIKCKEGVTYGSYGKGEKPAFFGSAYNYADESFWTPSTKENIWKVTVADMDVGLIVFNHGEIVGGKKLNGLIALEKNGDFYFNSQQDTVYLYCDKGNPGKVYDDIEIALHKNLFQVTNAHNVTIDNLKLKYIGAFGVSACGCDGLTITNCEIGFIGGAIQSGTLRYGNGIQVWNGVVNHRVENCWLYQIYDAALTFQGNDTYDLAAHMSNVYENITYTNNLIEFATYSFEFWHSNTNSTDMISLAVIKNFNCTNNISRFAGYGFGRQRIDNTGNHICVFNRSFPNSKGNNITNNIFDMADSFITKWGFNAGADMGEWNISNNVYYHGKNRLNEAMRYGSQYNATNQSTLEYAISIFEKNPKLVKWVD